MGLYDGDPHVVPVRDLAVLRAPNAYFAAEFYAGWCGHTTTASSPTTTQGRRRCRDADGHSA